MRSITFSSPKVILWLAIAGMAFTAGHPVRAQSWAPLKGSWMLMVDTPLGRLPVPTAFRPNGRGTIDFGGDSQPMVYREDGSTFSFSVEISREFSPNGQVFTMLIRGTRTSDVTLAGTAILISEVPDPAADIRVAAATGPVTGQRQ
jgi:hypothetical protein